MTAPARLARTRTTAATTNSTLCFWSRRAARARAGSAARHPRSPWSAPRRRGRKILAPRQLSSKKARTETAPRRRAAGRAASQALLDRGAAARRVSRPQTHQNPTHRSRFEVPSPNAPPNADTNSPTQPCLAKEAKAARAARAARHVPLPRVNDALPVEAIIARLVLVLTC